MAGGISINATLTGAASVLGKFARLEGAARGTVTKKAVRAGNKPQLRAAKSTSRFVDRTGKLRRGLRISVRSKQRGAQVTGKVIAGKGARHAMPVEYGHRTAVGRSGRGEKGVILRRRNGKPRALKVGETYGSAGGFVQGRHFMREAFDRTTAPASREFEREFVSGINREAARG